MRVAQNWWVGASLVLALSGPVGAETLTTYGTPGLIDLPSAYVLGDGEIALTTNRFGNQGRNTLTFQMLPRVYGTFRYGIIRGFDDGGDRDRFDRSFDVHYLLVEEGPSRPAVAIGLRDFGGTGIYSSEYLVATKSYDRFTVTGGLGFGRLAGRNGFDNPLAVIDDYFEERPDAGEGGINETGQLDFGSWFRGDAAIFGGVEYRATDRLSVQIEYSPDLYPREAEQGTIEIESPVNLGVAYVFPGGGQLRAFSVGGTELGLQYSYVLNPARRPIPGGIDAAPLPITPARQAILAGRDLDLPDTRSRAEEVLASLLADEGLRLEALTHGGRQAVATVENLRWDVEAQAVGRTARAMAQVFPESIDLFVITLRAGGMDLSTVTVRRADLELLDTDLDGAWRTLARSQIDDAAGSNRTGELDGTYPDFSYGVGPYVAFSFFDPESPLRADAGIEATFAYRPMPGLTFSGMFRQPLAGNIDDTERRSDSVIQRVRSDAVLYAIDSDFEINRLTADYFFRPGPDLFGRVTVGYLEEMYGGVSGELLWYPIDSRLALGAEVNYVRQRDFDMLLGFQDYDVVTGHASAYYDLSNGYVGQLDVGRYLAGDWGATLALEREFDNGFSLGGYFTLTDVPFEDFGEGSFDKGIRVSIPVSWLTGRASLETVDQVIQPVLRDGGARLRVDNRLYEVTRDTRAERLSEGWGRFYQ